MLIVDHMSIIDNHTSALLPYAYRRSYEHSSKHTCPCYLMLIEDHMCIIVNQTCPCYRMLIEDNMNIIDNQTCPLLPHADRRSYEHYSQSNKCLVTSC